MSAPLVWIGIPLVIAALLISLPWERWIAYLGTFLSLSLAGLAYWLPPDSAQRIGTFSFKIDSTFTILGRQVSLTSADQVIIILVYGIGAFWFFGTLATGNARRIVPLGLAIMALLVASLAVQPFLYAALLIEMAVLISIPMLAEPGQKPGRGLLRFLIYQSFAMPFILLAGFLLAGVEAGPADIALVSQAAVLLGLGFAFLLSIFPLYTWVPMLAEEALPYSVGFILTIFPAFSLVFGLNFIDRYSWLRDSAILNTSLRLIGLLMVVSAGTWAAFQRHFGRIFAYAAVSEGGLSLLALSLPDKQLGLQIVFFLIVPRALAYGVWTMSISILKKHSPELKFSSLQGLARQYPLASAGVVLSNLALAGTPLFASFPVRQALWEKLAAQSLPAALWFGLASLGLWVAAMRSMAVLAMAPANTHWKVSENWNQRILIGIGLAALMIFGLYPQWAQTFLANLPNIFEHLGK
ncbi:MAG TPA: proton-conducting transporter membrane subunit [Anaerolineales bacterium]|jgi:formate hydrogenlyase subunit 3/multisubunit Na+/H+ antiporter MnhD subunit